jgi:predicted permease
VLEFGRRLRQVWWRPSVREEVSDELEFHLAMRVRQLVAAGWSEPEARRAALRCFGSKATVAAECRAIGRARDRERRRRLMWTEWGQDLRYALRTARRTPGFTFGVIATLALGIGATTAIFSVVDAVLLKPLPFARADDIVVVEQGTKGVTAYNHSAANYLDLARDNRSFDAIGAYRGGVLALTRSGSEPLKVDALEVSPGFFQVFGVQPLVGQVVDSVAVSRGRVAVLSEGFWRAVFGGARDIIGSVIQLGGESTTIIGVMPASFRWPDKPDLWIGSGDVPPPPLVTSPRFRENRGLGYLQAVARIRPDLTEAAVRADLESIARRLEQIAPQQNEDLIYRTVGARESLVGSSRSALLLLLGAVGLVLLIASANVANLLLAKATTRSRELAVRAAIGANRGRLVRQLLTESVVLSIGAGAVGAVLAWAGTRALSRLAGSALPRAEEVAVDGRVLLFALAVAIVTGLLFGLSPALHLTRTRLAENLKAGGRTTTAGALGRLRNALVVIELALAVVVVIGAALLVTSLIRLESVDPGFRTDQVTAFDVPVTGSRYPTDSSQMRLYDALQREVQDRSPGSAVSLVFPMPFGDGATSSFTVSDAPGPALGGSADRKTVQALIGLVSPGYFRTVGIALIEGRDYAQSDLAGPVRVVVINQSLAKQLWPASSALGRSLYSGFQYPSTVIGVVADARSRRLDQPPEPMVYISHHAFMLPYLTLLVRSTDDPVGVIGRVRAAVRQVDPELALGDVRSLTSEVTLAVAAPRLRTWLLSGFAGLGLLLGSIGVYGVLSYLVVIRRRELAIQLALGASPGRAVRQMVWSGFRLALFGLALGLAASLVLSRFLSGLLYGVSATDPMTLGAASATLALVALIASYLPARRAARVDPLTVLRQD